jgi:outer membrane cobalamin receptor
MVDDVIVDDVIVVTAARREQLRSEVPAHVTVLEKIDLELVASRTPDDLLRRVPGFSLFRRASSRVAHPTTQGATLRGIGPSGTSRTLVLLDGVPLNDPFGGWVTWSRVSLQEVRRIEVVRGGISDLWGSAALAGAIHLITAAPSAATLRLGAEVGSREEATLHVAAGDTWGLEEESFGFLLQGDLLDTAGYPVVREDQRGAIDIPASSRHRNLGARLFWRLGPKAELRLRGDFFDENRSNGTPRTGNSTEATSVVTSLDAQGAAGGSWQARLAWFDQEFSSTFSSQAADRQSENPALDQFSVPSQALNMSLSWSRAWGAHHLGSGSDLRLLKGATNEEFFWNGVEFLRRRRAGGNQELYGVWLQESFHSRNFRFTGGVRADVWRSREGQRTVLNLESQNLLEDLRFEDRSEIRWSPRLALVYTGGAPTVRVALYRSFRAPTLNELFRPFRVRSDITAANTGLKLEELRGGEVGVEFGQGRRSLHLTGFWNEVHDPIANLTLAVGPGVIPPCGFVPAGGLCRQRRNLDRTRIRGVETEFRHRFAGGWDVQLSHLWNDGTVRQASGQPALEGRRLAQVPEHQASARLAWRPRGPFSAALDLRWVGQQFEDDLNTRSLDSFTSVDLALKHRLRPGLALVLGVENLFDEEFTVGETGDGIVTIGAPRLIHGGLHWSRKR